ncbi:MAG: FHA domain-containing protein [Verrucomicrobia bacterium]|nr:FHA domain-containing protein [Verrucomicrobiota bacterium]
MDKLWMITGPLTGAMIELIGEEITIGRASDNDICIADESVSDHHAVIARQNREYVVQDVGSASGTYVRGEKVAMAVLQNGDQVAFGMVEARFETTEKRFVMPAARGASSKSTASKLAIPVALVLLAVGGYAAYQRFGSVKPVAPAPTTASAPVVPPAAVPSAPAQAPQPAAPSTPVELPKSPPPAVAQIPTPGSEGKLKLDWLDDYALALKTAEAEKKPVVLDVTTDWCGWSKKMERETFAAPVIQEQLVGCVLVRINPEISKANEAVAKQYNVDGYPNLLILNYRGEVLAQESGYQKTEDFDKYLKKYLPAFKNGPLGYQTVQLAAEDPLKSAIARMPRPEVLPAHLGSVVLLDWADVKVAADGAATALSRTATYVIDPDKSPQPEVYANYNSSYEKVTIKSVRIWNLKGEGRPLDAALVEDEHAYSNQNVYWDVRRITLDLPPLKEGQILDVVQERHTKPVMPGRMSWRWITNGKAIVMGDMTVTFPSSLNLLRQPVRCAIPLAETKPAAGLLQCRLVTSHLNEPEPELFSPDVFETWSGYEFCTATTWNAVAAWYRGLCAGRDQLPAEAKTRVAELKAQHADPEALLQALFDWVTEDIRYVAVAFGRSSHQPHTVTETLQNRYGDCKDQSLLLQALCREAGFPASLVLLGTGYGRRFDTSNPGIATFNHCILEVWLKGKAFYLDPAAGRVKVGRLPVLCSATQALRIGEKSGDVILLPPYVVTQENGFERTEVKLNPNGSATVTEIHELLGPPAQAAKTRMTGVELEKLRKQLEAAYRKNGQKLLELSMTDANEPGDRFESRLSYTLPRFASPSSDGLMFRLGVSHKEGQDWTAALDLPRTRPFRFHPSDPTVAIYEVELPAGAGLKSKPDDLILRNSFVDASRKVVSNGNKVTLTETVRTLDARLAAAESAQVAAAFRKLQTHREHAFSVSIRPSSASEGVPPVSAKP